MNNSAIATELAAVVSTLGENEDAKLGKHGVTLRIRESDRFALKLVPWSEFDHVRPMGAPYLASVALPALRRQLHNV